MTVYARKPAPHLKFYVDKLGLGLRRETVNYDDPATLHLHLSCSGGAPLTLLFAPRCRLGRAGVSQVTALGFAVPDLNRCRKALGKAVEGEEKRFGQTVVVARDPDGLRVELFEGPALRWSAATLAVPDSAVSSEFLVRKLGWRMEAQEGYRRRLRCGEDALDLIDSGEQGLIGAGTVHHLALSVSDLDNESDGPCSTVYNRHDYRSVYLREPGGVLLELAEAMETEPEAGLQAGLALPPWLEPQREEIEARLEVRV